jgi:hypothetical protein
MSVAGKIAAVATGTVVGLVGAAAVPAVGASDTTSPVLKTPVKSSFVVGSQISADSWPDCGPYVPGDVWVSAKQVFTWTGSDDSGYVRYGVVENPKGESPYDVLVNSTKTSYWPTTTNANQECGGGSWMPASWDVTARDAAGNATTHNVSGGLFRLTQDTNNFDDSYYALPATIAYAGSWSTSNCTCWSDKTTHKTTAAAASATITVTVPVGGVTHLALVMAKAPDRGSAKVYIDGTLNATVDTHATTVENRIIVWQHALGKGTHKVKVVNVATKGHPRIDLDAVLTN